MYVCIHTCKLHKVISQVNSNSNFLYCITYIGGETLEFSAGFYLDFFGYVDGVEVFLFFKFNASAYTWVPMYLPTQKGKQPQFQFLSILFRIDVDIELVINPPKQSSKYI